MEFMEFLAEVLRLFLGVYIIFFVAIFLVVGCLCVFFAFLFYKFYLVKNTKFQQELAQAKHPNLFKLSEFFGAMVVVFLLMVFVFSLFAFIFIFLM